ncbi:hypothetical protein Ahy_A10g049418 isoform B [Arachis hypogaea]|uniref:Uncharacterized protein n=1 Tax=Arachis hypogaea TaxID=3818 RepID=A0A445B750_ARAHY|nr:hypothetical protein Ahy_A10g049418 isoform B [Arachis hypogaea]
MAPRVCVVRTKTLVESTTIHNLKAPCDTTLSLSHTHSLFQFEQLNTLSKARLWRETEEFGVPLRCELFNFRMRVVEQKGKDFP